MPAKTDAPAENATAPVQATTLLRSEHRRDTTPIQRVINGLTALAGHPLAGFVITLWLIAWIVWNCFSGRFGIAPFDPPPFPWLQGTISTLGLYVAILLISTQRREAQLADRRAHLTLEMAIIAEQKSAKIIQLLEEYRRDNPLVANRLDNEAKEMSAPTDHQSVLTSITLDEAGT